MKQSIGFDPIKEEVDGKKAKSIIWSTKTLELAMRGLEQGRRLVANPFYENNIKLLKGDLVFQRTAEEIEEWINSKNDILRFAEKHCKLMTPEGIKYIHLREYQKRYLNHLTNAQLSIYLSCRQSGKTTTSAIYLLHYAIFNIDKNVLVLGNKRKTAIEILDKIKKIYLELPFYLKPGIYKWNESEIVFDNGCRIIAEATTINSGIGFTFHCVLADEFAHVSPNILDSFYNNLFPTITAGKAKFIITSTQNGYNLFYRLYKAAEAGDNDYKAFKTDWWEVPEWDPENKCWVERTEEWHRRQVANYGSEEAFNKQFGTNFDLSANTLISQKKLSKQAMGIVDFINKDLYGIPLPEHFYWHPDYEPMINLKNDFIILTTDLAEGSGGDYNVTTISRMINPNTDDLEVIGYFTSNNITRENMAFSVTLLLGTYATSDRILWSFELNTYGELFLKILLDYFNDNPNIIKLNIGPDIIIKYYNDNMTKFKYGIKINSSNKKSACLLFKEDYEKGSIINVSSRFFNELTNFSDEGNGKFKASFGHDDQVMSNIQLEFVKQTTQYRLLRNEFNDIAKTNDKITDNYEMNDFINQVNNSFQYYKQVYENHQSQLSQSEEINIYQGTNYEDYINFERLNNYNRLNKFSNNG